MESKDERRGALTLVPTKDRLPEMLSDARNGADVAELVNKYGLRRKEAKALAQAPIGLPRERRTKRADKPDAQPEPKKDQTTQPDADKPAQKVEKYSKSIIGYFVGGCFIVLGLVGAGVGGWINWQFGFEAAGYPGALIGVVVDGGAMLLMVAAGELLRLRSWLCVVAFALWFPFLGGSTYAALNYTGVRLGDYFQVRDDIAAQRGDLASQIRRVEAQRAAIKEEGSAKVLENRVATELTIEPRCAKKTYLGMYYCDTYNKLKDAWTNADARDKLDATLTELHRQLDAKQAVASKNPAADQVVQISNGRVSADQAASYWLRWLATVPGLAGLMLTIGAALVGKTKC